MTDLYLKADDEATLDMALLSAQLTDADGKPVEGVNLDKIGIIERITGYDGNGDPITKTYDGFHANVRTDFDIDEDTMQELEPLSVSPPANPFRVWA